MQIMKFKQRSKTEKYKEKMYCWHPDTKQDEVIIFCALTRIECPGGRCDDCVTWKARK